MPPVISPKIIRSLGEQFCKMAPKSLSEENLSKKRKPKDAIGAEKAVDKAKKANDQPSQKSKNDEDSKNKKPKKKK